MGVIGPDDRLIRFGVFELNVPAGELRKNGVRLKLGEQPFRILHHLASHPGEIVTREELRKLLWGEDTFVDFDHGLNASINKVRETLGDSAATPRYIETVPRRGYRFIGAVVQPVVPVAAEAPGDATVPLAVPSKKRAPWRWVWIAMTLLLASAGGAWWGRAKTLTEIPHFAMRPLTADSGLTGYPAISRDGKLVAYASDRATSKNLDIWVHPLAEGAEPIRLTKDEADELMPDFSPDGGLVVYRSEREGGGIYVVPALGGEERLLVRGGRFPRFSPDGKHVAYTVGGYHFLTQSKIYLIPISGGPPRELAAGVPWAAMPAFSPDGRFLLYEGMADDEILFHDWWVVPVAGGPAVNTGGLKIVAEQLKLPRNTFGWVVSEFLDGRVLFTVAGQIWELDLSGPDWKARGPARPLTSGSTVNYARSGESTRLVFANAQTGGHFWKLKVALNQGKAIGEMEPLPHAGGIQAVPSATADGRLVAYRQTDPAGQTARLRDLETGKDSLLLNFLSRPKISPDGNRLAYNTHSPDSIQMVPTRGGETATLVPAQEKVVTQVRAWTSDGKKIVYWAGKPYRWFLMDVETRVATELMAHPKLDVFTLELSPDERWAAFTTMAGAQWDLWIAPVRDGKVANDKEWILVNRGRDERPWWSPDGNLLYTLSQRDESRCIWAWRLAPANKRPKGEPFAVYHFHGARVRVRGGLFAEFGPVVLPDGLLFSLSDVSGNVWIAEPER